MKNFPNKKVIELEKLSEEELLNVRVCDLPLSIAGTWLEECIQDLYKELESRGLAFLPKCYLADEWLTPEGGVVIGIPFYLAHPVLIRLEKKMMLEAEGETKLWCMKLLRHEAGHAFTYAYGFNEMKRWKDLFGSSTEEYADTYRYRPYSKNFVRHLEGFYAQYHPDEDFVETFAVWLTPGLDWEKKYAGWKVLEKLRYVDEIMNNIHGQKPVKHHTRRYWDYRTIRSTLRSFYKKKTNLRAEDFPQFHDNILKKIFSEKTPEEPNLLSAGEMIKKYYNMMLKDISLYSGEKKYVVGDILKNIQKRCYELKLVYRENEPIIAIKLSTYITTLVMNYQYTGWFRGDEAKREEL